MAFNTSYLQEFSSREDVESRFQVVLKDDIHLLLAWYGYGSYCGQSLVIFIRNEKLYEVNAYHCSCNGLEGQWQPEETSVAALKMRKLDNSCDGYDIANKKLKSLIKQLDKAFAMRDAAIEESNIKPPLSNLQYIFDREIV